MNNFFFDIFSDCESPEFINEARSNLLNNDPSTLFEFFKLLNEKNYLKFKLYKTFPSYECLKNLLSRGAIVFENYAVLIWSPIDFNKEDYLSLKNDLRIHFELNGWDEYSDLQIVNKIEIWKIRALNHFIKNKDKI